MISRSDRWFGGKGIYDPAGRMILSPFNGCKGISRTVVKEAQIHFKDENSANQWLKEWRTRSPYFSYAIGKDGLVLRWLTTKERDQLSVDLWHVCINGKRPKNLGGAMESAIEVLPIDGRFDCVSVTENVYNETQKQWQELWKSADDANKKIKALKQVR
jgi:hypothetical protein